MLNVHLYFVKWLGCRIVDAGIAVEPPIATFSRAIMDRKPHPNVWLAFAVASRQADWVAATDLDFASFRGGTKNEYVCSIYDVGRLSVRVRLSGVKLKDDWHPTLCNRFVIFGLRAT
jgi:hypothetical protein